LLTVTSELLLHPKRSRKIAAGKKSDLIVKSINI